MSTVEQPVYKLEGDATRSQKWKLFTQTGLDNRSIKLSKKEASDMIDALLNGGPMAKEATLKRLKELGASGEAKLKTDWMKVYQEAKDAGLKAMSECIPTPMKVEGYEEPIAGGVCGFAWVNFKGNTSWAKWCKKNGIVKDRAYGGGYSIWVSEGGQSMACKEAYARAFVNVLRTHKIEAYAMSRMD